MALAVREIGLDVVLGMGLALLAGLAAVAVAVLPLVIARRRAHDGIWAIAAGLLVAGLLALAHPVGAAFLWLALLVWAHVPPWSAPGVAAIIRQARQDLDRDIALAKAKDRERS